MTVHSTRSAALPVIKRTVTREDLPAGVAAAAQGVGPVWRLERAAGLSGGTLFAEPLPDGLKVTLNPGLSAAQKKEAVAALQTALGKLVTDNIQVLGSSIELFGLFIPTAAGES